MVRGLDLFRDHFSRFVDCYVLIGGTACDLIMSDAGLPFRATKDLDIVLCVEAIDRGFGEAFWQFVKTGQYRMHETSTGQRRFYRFQKPADEAHPAMLELFSRVPDVLSVAAGSHLTPIPIDEEISSLSAILLDDDYYRWVHAGKRQIEGVPVVRSEHLIPLKAKAWLDLRARRESDGRKHKNDVFRLYQVIDPDFRAALPATIADDMRSFLQNMANEHVDTKSLGLGSISVATVLDRLRTIYGII